MPEVLFGYHDFPPLSTGSGLRSAYFARHLPDHGWRPSVVALDGGQPEKAGVVRLPSATPGVARTR